MFPISPENIKKPKFSDVCRGYKQATEGCDGLIRNSYYEMRKNVMPCRIWYHLYDKNNVKNTHRGVWFLVKLQAEACNFTKSNTPPWVFLTFFYIAQMLSNRAKHLKCYLPFSRTALAAILTCIFPSTDFINWRSKSPSFLKRNTLGICTSSGLLSPLMENCWDVSMDVPSVWSIIITPNAPIPCARRT